MTPPKTPTRSAGKVLTRRIQARDSATITLNYRKAEADELRRAIAAIRLRGGRVPPMSLIARRSLQVWIDTIESNPRFMASELEALEKLATPLATRQKNPEDISS